jgi:hypothetical protein
MRPLRKCVFTLCVAFGNRILRCRYFPKYNFWIFQSVNKLMCGSINGEIPGVYGISLCIYGVHKSTLYHLPVSSNPCVRTGTLLWFLISFCYPCPWFSKRFSFFLQSENKRATNRLPEAGNTAIYVNVVYVAYVRGLAMIYGMYV